MVSCIIGFLWLMVLLLIIVYSEDSVCSSELCVFSLLWFSIIVFM